LNTVYAQNVWNIGGKILTKAQLIEDYEILYTSLVHYHPAPFQYISENDLIAFWEKEKSAFANSMTELEFSKSVRSLIAKIGCGHTFSKLSNGWSQDVKGKSIFIPFEVRKAGGRVYIKSTVDENFDFQLNDELIAINNIPIGAILEKMSVYQQRDGLTTAFVEEAVIFNFRSYYLLLYGAQEEMLIEYKTRMGEVKQTKVKPTDKKIEIVQKAAFVGGFNTLYENKWSMFAFDSTKNIAYLKIRSFSDRKEYDAYYKKVFEWLSQHANAQLILDIRNNGGGFFKNGNKLLTYLTKSKFEFNMQRSKRKMEKNKYVTMDKWTKWTKVAFSLKPSKHRVKGARTITFTFRPNKLYFKGRVNLITNGITFSQASLVAAHLKEHGAIVYGTETGGAEQSTNCMINYQLTLPNSNMLVIIPYYQVISNSTKGVFGYGVKPNYKVEPGLVFSEDNILLEVVNSLTKE
jgi:hypothetical protein